MRWGKRAGLIPKWVGKAAVGAVFALLGLASVFGWFAPLDNALRDLRFGLTTRGTTGDTVFVDIDSASLKSVGVWPWPRHLYAQMLDTLMEAGARVVVFDIDFSAASSEPEDAALERALADAGGYAYLAAFRQQQDRLGKPQFNLPLPRFARNADAVAVNVGLDAYGVVRNYPLAMDLDGRSVQSAAALLADRTGSRGEQIGIDFAIDPASIPRISAADLLAGRINAATLAGKQVVIGASAVELRDFFVVPRHGIVPGAMLQIEAAETLKQGRNLLDTGPWAGLAVLVLFAASVAILGRRRRVAAVAVAAAIIAVSGELCAAVLQALRAVLLDTAALDLGLGLVVGAVVIGEMLRRGTEKRIAEERLRYLATHDALTGLLSRSSFIDAVEQARRDSEDFAVVSLDLRRFRAINNTLGHAAGDQLLQQVAARLTAVAPHTVARLGGDTFALLVPVQSRDDLKGLCRTVVELLSSPYDVERHRATIAASAGAVLYSESPADAQTMLAHADMALSVARLSGDTGVALFDHAMGVVLSGRQQLDALLREAVFADAITLAYQPQVDLRSGRVIGAEALARWSHPELGNVSPQRFVAAAEETGLIVEMGRRLMLNACVAATQWPDGTRVAVNISPVQFELSDVVADIRSALTRSGLDPSRLEIELTEGVFVKNPEAVTQRLKTIRDMGVGIALDDFGTGYSSLAYLARLPIDRIKIDQAFVRRLPADTEASAIVATIISLARALNKDVIAEGIETAEQAALLAAAGCPLGQGYHFGRPGAAADLGFEEAERALAS